MIEFIVIFISVGSLTFTLLVGKGKATTWGVFEAVGHFPNKLQEVWGRIYSEWFPSSNYELAEGPEILWNEHKDVTTPNFRSQIWIPIVKKP